MTLQRILCAEDDPDIRTVIELALVRVGGFDVRICPHGGEVQAAAREFHPQLVVLDVMMPVLDGPGALKALRADPEFAALPVVFMTAKALRHEVQALLDLGAQEVVVKPFDPMALSGVLRTVWGRRYG